MPACWVGAVGQPADDGIPPEARGGLPQVMERCASAEHEVAVVRVRVHQLT
jgi:hypothetical protein